MTASRAGLILMSAFAAVKLALHLWVGAGYGYFRDEFYYLACADHPAWGYVDQPPLSIALLALSRAVLGDSVAAIRVLPALAGAATVFTTGWIARALGGGLYAMALAMLAALVAPLYLALDAYYSMNAFDLLLWTLGFAVLVSIFTREEGAAPPLRAWLALGVVSGLGLLNKWSVLWFAGGVFAGLLLTPERRHLATRGPWLAAGIAALMFLPNVLWQAAHDWATFEFIRGASTGKMQTVVPLEFVLGQVRAMHPLTLPVWLAGLVWLAADRRLRALAVLWAAVFLVLIANGTSRASYLAPAYTLLFAAGGVALARRLLPARLPLLRGAVFGVLLMGGAALAPLALPLLPVEDYVAYAARLGVRPTTDERKSVARLPQQFADMHGWEAIVAEVARVYHALPAADRARTSIFTYNYGEAGAIDLLGRRHGLPCAVSGHNNYWLWGTRGQSGEILIVIGGTEAGHLRVFERAEPAGVTDCGDCMPYENGQTIWVLRGPKYPVEEVWPQLKHYD